MNKSYFLSIILLCLCFSSTAYAQNATQDWSLVTGETSVFSSPRALDLNGDEVKDLVVGGGLESIYAGDGSLFQYDSDHMVMAIDGATGEFLWQYAGPDQIFGSPIFKDVTGDFVADVFVGGRNGFFMCINGANGELVWQFYQGSDGSDAALVGLYNFYNPQWIADQNGDGHTEILVSNGGDRSLPSWETNRPPGKLMVIDPITGIALAEATMPDNKETYMSPVVYDFFNDDKPDVIFGTGGETVGGNLYRVPLSAVMSEDLSGAEVLLTSDSKGFIAPPSLADLTQDNIPEIITNTYDGRIIALDGWTNEQLWEVAVLGAETNASPAIGLFTDDDIPDVFTSFLIGAAPNYTDVKQLMIDGATGELVYENDLGDLQYSSPVVYDMNSDGRDEAITMVNYDNNNGTFSHDVIAFDFVAGTETSLLAAPVGGTNIASTPWLGNLDNDGDLDIFFVHNSDGNSFSNEDSFTFEKYSLGVPDSNTVAWGGYMGNNGDGFFQNPMGSCFETIQNLGGFYNITEKVTAPFCSDEGTGDIDADSNGCPCMFNDCVFSWYDSSLTLDTINITHHAYGVSEDTYYVHIVHEDGCVMVKRIEVGVGPTLNINNNNCNGAASGSVSISPIKIPYDTTLITVDTLNDTTFTETTLINLVPWDSYVWSNGQTGQAIFGLTAGTYSVDVMAPNGDCEHTMEFVITEPEPFEAIADVSNTCVGESNGSLIFEATGGVGNYALSWGIDGGPSALQPLQDSETVSIDGLSPATYSYTISNGTCGTVEGTLVIEETPPFDISNFQSNGPECSGEGSGVLEMVIQGGADIYYFSASNLTTGDNYEEELANGDVLVTGLSGGDWTYQLLDDDGCNELVGDFSIIDPAPVELNLEPNAIVCGDDMGSVFVEYGGGLAPYTLTVLDENGVPTSEFSHFDAEEGSHTFDLPMGNFELLFEDENSCIQNIEFEIIETPDLGSASSVEPIICAGETGGYTANVTGGTGPYFYSLDGENYIQLDEDVYEATEQAAGNYTVYFQDANNCETTVEAVISEVMPLGVTAETTNAATLYTEDGSIQVTITGGTPPYTYSVAGATGENEDGSLNVGELLSGEYTVDISDANGCNANTSTASIAATDPTVTGIADLKLTNIDLYPNPNRGEFVVNAPDLTGKLHINIYNTVGQEMAFETTSANGQTRIKMQETQSGVYFVELSDGTATALVRVIVL